MKRFFILATAAIVALASCAKTEVVYNDAPEEISFKALTDVITKAPVTDAVFPTTQTMSVYGWNNADKAQYFDPNPTVFVHNTSAWKGNTSQYYPATGALDFVAFSQTPTTCTDNLSYELTLAENTTAQHDLMASKYVAGKDKNSGTVTLPFHHTLSLVQVNFKCTGTDVQIKSVELTNTMQEGTVEVSYAAATDNTAPTIDWTPTGTATPISCNTPKNLTAGADYTLFANFLAVPESTNDKKLNIQYVLNGNTFTHPIDITNDFAVATKYVFNITIGMTEVLFDASVVDWTEGPTENPSI